MPPFFLAASVTVRHTTNWYNVAVIVSSIIVSAGIVITWITRVVDHQEKERVNETRSIVLEALGTHMAAEEQIRADDTRRAKKWRKEIRRELAELRAETTRGYELQAQDRSQAQRVAPPR